MSLKGIRVASLFAMQYIANSVRSVLTIFAFCWVSGCATVPAGQVNDPLEPFNRVMFGLNDGVDTVLLKPAATVYKAVLPDFVRQAFGNFFGNLAEPWVAVNAGLQFKGQAMLETMLRFGVNTFFGFGGVLDVAGGMGIERRNEDFGQTLGYWGINPGPYVVWPFFGSSNLRDSVGLAVDFRGDPLNRAPNVLTTERDTLSIVRLLDFRANLLKAGNLMDEIALDKYIFTRDVYLQRRRSLVFDGNEPPEPDDSPEEAKPNRPGPASQNAPKAEAPR